MDEYFRELNKIVSNQDLSLQTEIKRDLLKLEFWRLPDLYEIEMYVDKLEILTTNEWKFIFKEFKSYFHFPKRNEEIIKIIQSMRRYELNLKPIEISALEKDIIDGNMRGKEYFERLYKNMKHHTVWFRNEFRNILL